MDTGNPRIHAYKNGKSFEQCKEIAESMNPKFKEYVEKYG